MRGVVVTALLLVTGCGGGAPEVPDAAPVKRMMPTVDAGMKHAPPSVDAGMPDAENGLEALGDAEVVGPMTIQVEPALPAYLRVLAEANGILADLKSTVYDHDTYIDEETGTFDLDCSGFINFVLAEAALPALETLEGVTSARPIAAGYTNFMATLPPAGDGSWHRVDSAMDLVAGDLVAWIEPAQLMSMESGHAGIVASPPTAGSPGQVLVSIVDSTDTPHGSTDPRTASQTTGVGQGTVVLIVDATGAPTGFRWSTDEAAQPYTTMVSLGHLE